MLREVELGADAFDFMREHLLEGTTLAKRLALLPLAHGRAVTFLPESTAPKRIRAYSTGGLLDADDLGAPGRRTIDFMSIYLDGSGERCAIFEDINASPNHPEYGGLPIRYLVYLDEVYPFVTRSAHTHQSITQSMDYVASYRMVSALWSSPIVPSLTHKSSMQTEIFDLIAARCEHIVMMAYDGEGFLVWSRGRYQVPS